MEALREPGMIHVKAMCVISKGGKTLATRGYDPVKDEHYYRLVGGGVHFCELGVDALGREVAEELGSGVENVKYLELVENIFTYKGEPGHEVIFIYSADLSRKELYEQEEITIIDHPTSVAVWVPIADILSGSVILFPTVNPAFLKGE